MSVQGTQPAQERAELATLGDGKVFVRRTETGLVKAVKAQLRLEERKGQLAEFQGKVSITAAGYNELNKIAGISVITPDKLTLPEGNAVVNPFPILDKASGTISKVWVKKLGIGLSPIGNLTITSSTLLYDIPMYFIQDLAKKIQYNAGAGRICLESTLTEEDKRKGIFYRIEGDLGVWADVSHKEVLKALDTFIQNKLFAERKAQTIAERNVLKKHPSLSTIYVDAQGLEKARWAVVNVIGFSHDFSQRDLLDIAEKAAANEPITYNNKRAEIIETTCTATEEDLAAGEDGDANAEGQGTLLDGGGLL